MYDSAKHYERTGQTRESDELNNEPACPYCGALLVQRDTYALPGGDETYEWCPDCMRVIENMEVT